MPLGILTPQGVGFSYVRPPDDRYYTLLDASQCPSCAAGGGALRAITAHVLLGLGTQCSFPVVPTCQDLALELGPGCCFTGRHS